MNNVTRILSAIDSGDPRAAEALLPLVYEELRRLAAQRMSHEPAGQTLSPTGLVHEAYLRLVGKQEITANRPQWNSRGHFFVAAAEAMRRILIETARRKRGPKRGGQMHRIDADLNGIAMDGANINVLDLNEALERLAEESPKRAELVKLRFFGGLSIPESAEILGISTATAERYWTYARTRLFVDLGGTTDHHSAD